MRRLLAIIGLLLSTFILFLHPVNSGDFFHHIATGRDIILTGSLPRVDTWTFTAAGKPWIAHSWGSGVLYYVVHSLFGYEGISVLFALIGTLTTIFLYLTLRKLAIHRPVAILIALTTAAFISLRWPSRPEVIAPFFVSVLFYLLLLEGHVFGYIIPVVIWLWSIMYGSSVFMGIILLAVAFLTLRPRKADYLWIFVLSILAAFGNGYGWQSFAYIFTIPKIAGNVGEWLPVTAALDPKNPGVVLFYQYQFLVYGLLVGGTTILLLWAMFHRRDLLANRIFYALCAGALIVPFAAVRFVNLAPLLAAPILALLLTHLSRRAQVFAFTGTLALGMAAAAVRIATYPVSVGLAPIPFGSSAIEYLVKNNISGNIYASQEMGGYIHWRLPDSKIFYDTRDDLYTSTAVPADLSRLTNGQTDLRTLLRTYKADIVVAEADQEVFTPLLYLDTWKLVHVGDSQFVLLRTSVADRYGLSSYSALDPTRSPSAKPGELKKAKEEMTQILKQQNSAEQHIRMADILLALGETAEAVRHMEEATIEGFLGMSAPQVRLGFAEIQAKFYLASRQCTKAHTALLQADRHRSRPFLFSPKYQLFSTINRYWGQYYIDCDRDITKAREYLIKYAAQTTNSRERKIIESMLNTLVQ